MNAPTHPTNPTDAEEVEAAIVASNPTAPRVTLADLEANIVDTEIVRHVTKSGKILRWAILTTRCGFAVTGRPSASVSIENDRPDLGESIARDNAREELWPLMGYALQAQLAAAREATDAA